MRDACLANPVAQRTVRLVAEGCSGASIYAEGPPADGADGGDYAAAPVTPALIETVASQLMLHGDVFVRAICDGEAWRPNCSRFGASGFRRRPIRQVGRRPHHKVGQAKSSSGALEGLGCPYIIHLKASPTMLGSAAWARRPPRALSGEAEACLLDWRDLCTDGSS